MKASIIAKEKCKCIIDTEIIEQLIGELLFDTSAESNSCDDDIDRRKRYAMRAFVFNEDDKVYVATVNSVLKMNLIVKFLATGVPFRQASRIYHSVKEELRLGVLGCVSDVDVANQCRIVCAINLQYLKEMLNNVWAFSISIDAGNNEGTSYLDLRVRCYLKNNLQNFHLIAIPMRERHTGKYQYNLVVAALDVLALQWRHQLIKVASDGASAMSGCVQGTCTHLERECHNPIFRIWCGAHQLDLVIKKAFKRLCSERFVNQLTAVTAH